MLSKACNVLSVHMDFDRFQYAVCILGCALCSAHSLVSRVYYLVSSVDYLLCSVQNAVGCVECSCAAGGGGGWLWRENTACGKSLPASQRPTLTSELHSTRWLSTAHQTLHTLHTANCTHYTHGSLTVHTAHTTDMSHCTPDYTVCYTFYLTSNFLNCHCLKLTKGENRAAAQIFFSLMQCCLSRT